MDKIWIYEHYRRMGITSGTVKAIAQYFDVDVSSIGWFYLFTEAGEALVRSICPDVIYITQRSCVIPLYPHVEGNSMIKTLYKRKTKLQNQGMTCR